VIEDNIIHITLLTEQLTTKMGVLESKITCVFDGHEAIAAIVNNMYEHLNDPNQQLFSLIITDFNVPGNSAIEILVTTETQFKKVKKPYPAVLMLTASNEPYMKELFFKEKLIDGFFNKPV
jgi:CheY-like chemotaxis protein